MLCTTCLTDIVSNGSQLRTSILWNKNQSDQTWFRIMILIRANISSSTKVVRITYLQTNITQKKQFRMTKHRLGKNVQVGNFFIQGFSLKRNSKSQCKIAMQKKNAKSQCKIAMQNRNAKLQCKIAMQNRNAKSQCKI